MQALVALPEIGEMDELVRPVCGIPLLLRVITTAVRSGATSVLIVYPSMIPQRRIEDLLKSPVLGSVPIHLLAVADVFNPKKTSHWHAIESCLEPRVLWIPWNYVTSRAQLAKMIAVSSDHPYSSVGFKWPGQATLISGSVATPRVFIREELNGPKPVPMALIHTAQAPGVTVRSEEDRRAAERELVYGSGKPTDGIYSRFNRRLCRPAVRLLAKTRITPNAVTYTGLLVAVFAGLCYAQGYWAAYVAGGLLFFLSGLFDEADGMLARVTFRDSAFGCWLEGFVDYATYLLVFAGMTIGLQRQMGTLALVLGGSLLFGSITSFVVIARQRKIATSPDKPNEYQARVYQRLEEDSANLVSRLTRQVQFLIKKGVLVHYVLLFSVIGILPLFLALGAFGSNVTWILTLYFNKRLFGLGQTAAQVKIARAA